MSTTREDLRTFWGQYSGPVPGLLEINDPIRLLHEATTALDELENEGVPEDLTGVVEALEGQLRDIADMAGAFMKSNPRAAGKSLDMLDRIISRAEDSE